MDNGIVTVVPVIGLALVLMGIEALAPGRPWPKVPGWLVRALSLNSVQILSVFLIGVTWDRWLPGLSLWDASGLGLVGGGVIGYLAITFVYYWWHRWRHESRFLWRFLHQIHHSAQRIEILTSFYKHPYEILCNGLLSSLVLYSAVGLNPAQATLAVALSGIAELFYHWNIKTPYWIGFVFQRPESHCIHHMEGHHRQNYSDLPFWDILFGTFNNPRTFSSRCGFANQDKGALVRMLRGHSVD
jgi:sterol desaturase/sphingolipid hydroxylase (fatty acid hydroxylase superfamily)